MPAGTTKEHYLSHSVSTASPAQLVMMMYDVLLRDLGQAEQAVLNGEMFAINERLCHAQAVVLELRSSLDVSKWSGGAYLAQLYTYWLEQMVEANINKDAGQIALVREQIEPVAAAWREIAAQVA